MSSAPASRLKGVGVAGRGLGEVPLLQEQLAQRAEEVELVAPVLDLAGDRQRRFEVLARVVGAALLLVQDADVSQHHAFMGSTADLAVDGQCRLQRR